jgi:hypothetical protein
LFNPYLNAGWEVNREIIEQRTGMKFSDFLSACIDIVDTKKDSQMFSGIGELLDPQQKEWGRNKLKTETIFSLKLLLDSEKHGQPPLRQG